MLIWVCGGIGIHSALRTHRRKDWEFDSPQAQLSKLGVAVAQRTEDPLAGVRIPKFGLIC